MNVNSVIAAFWATLYWSMTLSRRKVGVIIGLVIVALGGLVVLQTALLNYAMTLKEQAFRRNVMAALGQISQSVATGEAIMVVFATDTANEMRIEARMEQYRADSNMAYERIERTLNLPDSTCIPQPSVWTEGDTILYTLKCPQHVVLKLMNTESGIDTVVVDSFQQAGSHRVAIDKQRFSSGEYVWHYRSDSASFTLGMSDNVMRPVLPIPEGDSGRFRFVTSVVQNLASTEFEPIEQRLDSINVDSIVATTLQDNGIDLEYAYGVLTDANDSLHIAKPAGYEGELRESEYKVRLFPHDIFAARASLALYFPGRGVYLWKQMGPLFAATVVLMLVIIGCFAYTIRTILQQRRFSGHMVDFINNMTHEFKTPISTVALAAEAIRRPDVVEQPEQVLRFTEMIQSENRRMRHQTDKILQMATLENDDYDLSLTDVDLHAVIQSAVDAIALHVENRKGAITCRLTATAHTLRADKVHLTNVVYNLLDNANKYSEGPPAIAIHTFDSNQGVGMRITDQGIGLKPEDKKHVFEKFYRVPTGNRHDVKGFGLGLSYVKLIVEAHGGTIMLNSRLGEGTEVEVILPLRREEPES